jgi:hypothetical protein
MSVYAVERIRQIMDSHIGQALLLLVMNTDATERVESWLEDGQSRESYRRELAFVVLRGLLRDDLATVNLTGSVKLPDWERALARVAELCASGPPSRHRIPSGGGVGIAANVCQHVSHEPVRLWRLGAAFRSVS